MKSRGGRTGSARRSARGAREPLVSIVMGSASDLPVMKAAAETLDEFGVPYEVRIVSAHRTPRELVGYATTLEKRGVRVVIAGAGGAAHLPGMVASMTAMPVIGVPVPLKEMKGLDSLLSIAQMPAGVPVATVAIGNARNAGLLAVQVLAYGGAEPRAGLQRKLRTFKGGLRRKVRLQAAGLRSKRVG